MPCSLPEGNEQQLYTYLESIGPGFLGQGHVFARASVYQFAFISLRGFWFLHGFSSLEVQQEAP